MISIVRDNTRVVVKFETDLANNCSGTDQAAISFHWECGREYLADAMTRYLSNRLGECIEAARREAYNMGWKDAKAKRTKQTHFYDFL